MKTLSAIVVGLILSSCAATSAMDSAIKKGGVVDSQSTVELIGSDGVTLTATSGDWTAYMSPDGRKVVSVTGKETKELTWRVNDDGQFCEQLFSESGKEVCGQNLVRIKRSDGSYLNYKDGVPDSAGTYNITRGNKQGF